MKPWQYYAKKALEYLPLRLMEEDCRYIKSKKKRKKAVQKNRKQVMLARDFEQEYGFPFEETWSLDTALALFLYPRLAYLRDNHHGYPSSLLTNVYDITEKQDKEAEKEWVRILDTMTRGFYLYTIKDSFEWNEEEKKLWEQTMELFVHYYSNLWD